MAEGDEHGRAVVAVVAFDGLVAGALERRGQVVAVAAITTAPRHYHPMSRAGEAYKHPTYTQAHPSRD